MVTIEFEVGDEEKDICVAELWEQGSVGIAESELGGGRHLLRAFFDSDAGLLDRFTARRPKLAKCPDRDWVAVSQATWKPRLVGSRFFLVPEWRDDPTPSGRLRIEINPGMACGTGAHPATRLCLEAIERHLRPGATVLDIGAGSGILAIAAALAGAGLAIACDNDPAAVEVAARNIARAGANVKLFTGSIDSVAASCIDLAVCNISATAAAELAPAILRALNPDGAAVLSGFERNEETGVCEALAAYGGVVRESAFEGDWCALIYSAGAPNGPRTSSSLTATSSSSSSS